MCVCVFECLRVCESVCSHAGVCERGYVRASSGHASCTIGRQLSRVCLFIIRSFNLTSKIVQWSNEDITRKGKERKTNFSMEYFPSTGACVGRPLNIIDSYSNPINFLIMNISPVKPPAALDQLTFKLVCFFKS